MGKWLIFILGVALVLRVWGLSNLPPGFTPDEASFGYDAWSILTTGRDQWGKFLPLTLKSFGDYKAPLYAYICIPFVAILGLTHEAVRLPNALLSVAAVAVVYGLVVEWFGDKRVALVAAGLLAVSPWEVMLARGGFEANLTMFLLPVSVWALAKGRGDPRWLYLAGVVAGVNLFSYHSAKLVTLPVMGAFVWLWRKEWRGEKRKMWLAVAILGVFIGVALWQQFAGAGRRAADVSIANPDDKWAYVAERRYEAVKAGMPEGVAWLFSNKLVYLGEVFFKNYLSYFSPEFLFSEGPREGTYGMMPGVGVLYPIELVFLVGFLLAVCSGKNRASAGVLVFWLVVAAVPAALAKGPGGAASRAAAMMPAWQIVSAVGAVHLWTLVRNSLWQRWLTYGAVFLVLASGLGWLENYVYHSPKVNAASMLYGRQEAMEYVGEVEGKYDRVVVSRLLSEPQMFTAFYLAMPPGEFQEASRGWKFEELGLTFLDQMPVYSLGKFEFRKIDWEADRHLARVLLVGDVSEIPSGPAVVKEVLYPNGKVAVRMVGSEGEAVAKR